MSASATIANSLLRRAFGGKVHRSSLDVLFRYASEPHDSACPSRTGHVQERTVSRSNEHYPRLKFSISSADIPFTMNNAVSASMMLQQNGAPSTDGEILTVLDVARFLRVPKSTVYKLARVGELPASKIGKHWRFLRRDIHEWMHSRSKQG
jgi:excisionase family DNA binding protein